MDESLIERAPRKEPAQLQLQHSAADARVSMLQAWTCLRCLSARTVAVPSLVLTPAACDDGATTPPTPPVETKAAKLLLQRDAHPSKARAARAARAARYTGSVVATGTDAPATQPPHAALPATGRGASAKEDPADAKADADADADADVDGDTDAEAEGHSCSDASGLVQSRMPARALSEPQLTLAGLHRRVRQVLHFLDKLSTVGGWKGWVCSVGAAGACWLPGWLVGWLFGVLAGVLVAWLTGLMNSLCCATSVCVRARARLCVCVCVCVFVLRHPVLATAAPFARSHVGRARSGVRWRSQVATPRRECGG